MAFNSGALYRSGYGSGEEYSTDAIRVGDGAVRTTVRATDESGYAPPLSKGPLVGISWIYGAWSFFAAETFGALRLTPATLEPGESGYPTGRVVHLGINFDSRMAPATANDRWVVVGPGPAESGQSGSVGGPPWSGPFYARAFNVDGTLSWSTTVDEHIDPLAVPGVGPAIMMGHVIVPSGAGDAVLALNERDGSVQWRTPVSGLAGPFAVTFEAVLVASNAASGVVVSALSLATGELQWQTTVGQGELSGAIAVGADVAYIGESDGSLYALSTQTGELLKTISLGGAVTDPIVSDGRVFTGTRDRLVALGL